MRLKVDQLELSSRYEISSVRRRAMDFVPTGRMFANRRARLTGPPVFCNMIFPIKPTEKSRHYAITAGTKATPMKKDREGVQLLTGDPRYPPMPHPSAS